MSARKFSNTGEVIYRNRVMNRISQADLAREIGYKNGQYISNLERGKCGIPTSKIKTIAKALRIDPREIVVSKLVDYENSLLLGIAKS